MCSSRASITFMTNINKWETFLQLVWMFCSVLISIAGILLWKALDKWVRRFYWVATARPIELLCPFGVTRICDAPSTSYARRNARLIWCCAECMGMRAATDGSIDWISIYIYILNIHHPSLFRQVKINCSDQQNHMLLGIYCDNNH